MKSAELCAGYGALALAIEEVFGTKSAWFSEFEEAPSKILKHHWPTIPNLGDMTKIDWSSVEPVDVLGAGTPCQDLSAAGRRAGMTEGSRSNLAVEFLRAVEIIRPKYVVWENVRGAYSAKADSDLEFCPGCMGDAGDGRVVLRALGRLLGDLSDLGYDSQWRGLRAADVGACHGRFRVFVLARRRDAVTHARGIRRTKAVQHNRTPASYACRTTLGRHPGESSAKEAGASGCDGSCDSCGERHAGHGWEVTAYDAGAAWEPAESGDLGTSDGSTAEPRECLSTTPYAASSRCPEGQDGGAGSRDASQGPRGGEPERAGGERTVPTPNPIGCGRVGRSREAGRDAQDGVAFEWPSEGIAWGEYEPAIRRWERTIGRRAPRPTEPTGRNNGHRLSPRFTEWMMGLPYGWVTDPAIGISRNEQLKACGNGVVPQQAIAALRNMLAAFEAQERIAA